MNPLTQIKNQILLSLIAILSFSTTAVYAQNIYDNNISTCESYATKALSQKRTIDQALAKSGQIQCQVAGIRWTATYTQHKNWCQTWDNINRMNVPEGEIRARGVKILQCINAIHPAGSVNFDNRFLSDTPNELGEKLTNEAGLNHLRKVKKILAAGAPTQWQGNWGNDGQALKYAIEHISLRTTRLLLKIGGFHPDATSNGGFAPLAIVTASNDINKYKMMKLILKNGATADHVGEIFDTNMRAINMAIENEDIQAIKILLKYGSNPNLNMGGSDTVLLRAIYKGNPYIVFLLLSGTLHPADPNVNEYDQNCGSYSPGVDSPLDRATTIGNAFIIDQLLHFGAKRSNQC